MHSIMLQVNCKLPIRPCLHVDLTQDKFYLINTRGPQLSIIPYEISKSSDFGIDSKISRRFQRDSKISQRFPARFQPTMIQHALHVPVSVPYRRLQLDVTR